MRKGNNGRKIVHAGVILAIVLAIILPTAAAAPNQVLKQGVVNLDTGEKFRTIQSAIDDPDTLNGHTLFVYSGIYPEEVTIMKSIRLIGEDKKTTVIAPNLISDTVQIFADSVTVSGFTILTTKYQHGVTAVDVESDENRISDNIIHPHDVTCEGLSVIGSGNFIILNEFLGGEVGIELSGEANYIHANTFEANTIGLFLVYASSNAIWYNNFIKNDVNAFVYYGGLNWWDDNSPDLTWGNYWSDYTGVDADGDGIGDTPHYVLSEGVPKEYNVDNGPLMKPYTI